MSTETHTMAGLLAPAGAARLSVVTGAACATGTTPAAIYGGAAVHQVSDKHQSASWTQGVIAKPVTFMVFNRNNRPTRTLSELSP